MSAILKQRNFLVTRIFEISDRSLKIRIWKPLNYLEEEFTFEELGTKVVKIQKPDWKNVIVAGAMLFISSIFFYSYLTNSKETPLYEVLICIGILLLFVLFAIVFHKNETHLFLFDNLRYITFYLKSPNKKAVDDFILQIHKKQKEFLLGKYARVDTYLSSEVLSNNLKWLWEKGIIDNNELENFRREIVPRPTDSSIGFKFTNPSN